MEGNHFGAVDGGVLMVRVMELPPAAVGDDCLGLVEFLLSYISSAMEFYESLMQWTFIDNPNFTEQMYQSFIPDEVVFLLAAPRRGQEADLITSGQ